MADPQTAQKIKASSQADLPVIEVRDLVKRFGAIEAVRGISFSIRTGEVFGLLGPNGAGKTTTIRMLNGILRPDSGEVLINGQPLTKGLVKHKLRMGVIPEHSNVYGDLTAYQNVFVTGKFYGHPKSVLKTHTNELLDRFGLAERSREPVRNLSKGMRQRVNIASALVHDPEILFLDEPTSGLDVKSQRLIKETMQECSHSGATIVLTTHNIEEANSLCDRVCIINQGKVVVIDSPENLKKTYESIQSVEICFDSVFDAGELHLDGLTGRIQKMGDKWKLYTSDPDQLVKHLVDLARRRDLTILSLNIQKASLEDVFVALTEGRSDAR